MSSKKTTKSQKKRIVSLDIIRAIAILFMIIAHTVAYTYSGINPVVEGIREFINIVSITTFLFISGSVAYKAYLGGIKKNNTKLVKKVLRSAEILSAYYILAFAVSIPDILYSQSPALIVRDIFLLNLVPGYTEFLLPFVFFLLVVAFFAPLLKKIVHSPFWLIFTIVVSFTIGEIGAILIYPGVPFFEWLTILVGSTENFRFPLLQYFSVYLIGMHWGKIIADDKEDLREIKRETIFSVGTIIVIAGYLTTQSGLSELLRRFPPSVPFLLLGLAWCFFLISITYKFKDLSNLLENLYFKSWILPIIAKNPLIILVVHTITVTMLSLIGVRTTNLITVFASFVLSGLVSVIAAILIGWGLQRLNLKNTKARLQLLLTITTGWIVLLALLLAITASAGGIDNVESYPEVNIEDQIKGFSSWQLPGYSSKYTYIKPNQQGQLLEKDFVEFKFDLEELSELGVISESKDIQVVAWKDFKLTSIKVAEIETIQDSYEIAIDLKTDWDYVEIYFSSNAEEEIPLFFKTEVSSLVQETDYPTRAIRILEADFESEDLEEISDERLIDSERTWHLPGDKIQLSFQLNKKFTESDKISYEILDSNGELISGKNITWEPNYKYELEYELDQFSYGTYWYQVKVDLGARSEEMLEETRKDLDLSMDADEYIFQPVVIKYSAPLYVTWTMDWEGFDLTQTNWNAINSLSDQYDLPVSHYFNPRIYTNPDISPERASSLTNMVKQRSIQHGDEVSLHLHMHCDMIEAAGLEPKEEPKWGGREDCHDVLTSAYEYDEFKQLVQWSLGKFAENGLGKPVGYRAGGWFLDLENMRVLNELGFTYDTSGSDYSEPYGVNRQTRDWYLTPVTKPYQVSFNSINNSQAPVMNIWEYPNNGADSSNRSAEELIRRFNLNYQLDDGIVKIPQVLTYLSHPHWFVQVDEAKMKPMLTVVDQHNYADDKGAVVYVTQIEAHNKYTKLIAR